MIVLYYYCWVCRYFHYYR